MRIRIVRQACCAQDDQTGALETEFDMKPDGTLAQLVRQIEGSRFLQFSATHNRITGEAAGRRIVDIYSQDPAFHKAPDFYVDSNARVTDAIGDETLFFGFRAER